MKVLVLTIEDEPPSLRNYDNDKQRNGESFSSAFEDFYRKCLNKNAKARPSTLELLKHKLLKGRTRDSLLTQLLMNIDSVGGSEVSDCKINLSHNLDTSQQVFPLGDAQTGLQKQKHDEISDSTIQQIHSNSRKTGDDV